MGWRDVHVLDGGVAGEQLESGPRAPHRPPLPAEVATITPQALAAKREQTVVIDLATSPDHASGHVPGAWFVVRARLK